MSRRTLTNNKISLLLLTVLLLLCSINVTPRQRLDRRHHNRTLADGPTFVPASQISSTNGLIAFSAAEQIYVMNGDGSDIRRITEPVLRVYNDYPAFSPDGLRIAFISFDMNNLQHTLYIADIDGSRLQRIISGPAFMSEPAWSPDGSKIAFARGHDNTREDWAMKLSCRPEIYVVDVFTHKFTSLTQGEGGTDPAWSPDGTRIAFNSFREGNNEIYTMSSEGGDVQRLTDTPWAEAEPAWSPDGKQIAYAAHLFQTDVGCGFIPMGRPPNTETEPSYIYVMDCDGTKQTRLEITGGGNEPTWSPDGASLAFALADKNGREIYVTDASGSGLTKLTSGAEEKSSLSWSNASR
jgi:Tol biopolymer transport system component